jgi:hypothetical protein
MMLMTKFGKFKLRLIATIHLATILSIFNIASTSSNYWIKYKDQVSQDVHFAGLWRSCPNQGPCIWKNGIISHLHTMWSLFVRFFITFGTSINILVIFIFLMALIYKINKRSRVAIRLLEYGNFFLITAFVFIIVGFCIFISTSISFSMWLLILSMCIALITSNMLTRTFATLYFQNTRMVPCSKSVEAALSHTKLDCEEEKIALNPIESVDCSNVMTAIEMNKVSEANGSNEALIPSLNGAAETNAITTVVECSETTTDSKNIMEPVIAQ